MFCTKCGAGLVQGAAFCAVCGQPTGGTGAGIVSPTAGAAWQPVPVLPYAGFWLRFVAGVIDGFILAAGFAMIVLAMLMLAGLGSGLGGIHLGQDISEAFAVLGVMFVILGLGIGFVGNWLYHAMSESSSWQATLGKKAMGIIVTDMAGRQTSFGRASGRHFSKIISGLIPFAIGYIVAGFTEKKQAVHDLIAGCLVLRKM